MPYKQRLSRKAKIRRIAYALFFGMILAVIGTIVYLIVDPGGGPRGVSRAEREVLSPQEREILMEESREAESRFRDAVSDDELPDEDAIAALREAYDKQRRAVVNNPYASVADQQRLDRLREDVVEYEGGFLSRRMDQLRAEAEERRGEGDHDAAIDLLEEVREIQERINREMRGSPHASTAAISSLNREILNWQAEPVIEFSRRSEQRAREAVAEGRWGEALEYYTEARDAQARINEEFQRTPFVNRSRINALAEEISTLRTQEIRARIAELREDGAGLFAAERYPEAAERFAEAAERQRELNREFPGSRFASSEAVRELERAYQTALSGEPAGNLMEAVDALDASLREGDAERALAHLDAALRWSERLESEFPRSDFRDESRDLRLGYLDSIRDRIPGILEDVLENLLPVPGHPDVRLHAYETSQDLYRRIMNRNPSRNVGENLPVDSLNWEEAREFCRRLSWVLAGDVRLPTREEFLAAAATGGEAVSEIAWHLPNSGGEGHEVGGRNPNAHGFYDLWGNVAEWLGPVEDRRAPVAGGSFNDDLSDADTPPVEWADTNQRSRAIGFRFAVEAG